MALKQAIETFIGEVRRAARSPDWISEAAAAVNGLEEHDLILLAMFEVATRGNRQNAVNRVLMKYATQAQKPVDRCHMCGARPCCEDFGVYCSQECFDRDLAE
jgi:hypothetical protein